MRIFIWTISFLAIGALCFQWSILASLVFLGMGLVPLWLLAQDPQIHSGGSRITRETDKLTAENTEPKELISFESAFFSVVLDFATQHVILQTRSDWRSRFMACLQKIPVPRTTGDRWSGWDMKRTAFNEVISQISIPMDAFEFKSINSTRYVSGTSSATAMGTGLALVKGKYVAVTASVQVPTGHYAGAIETGNSNFKFTHTQAPHIATLSKWRREQWQEAIAWEADRKNYPGEEIYIRPVHWKAARDLVGLLASESVKSQLAAIGKSARNRAIETAMEQHRQQVAVAARSCLP